MICEAETSVLSRILYSQVEITLTSALTPKQGSARVLYYNLFMQNDESSLKLRGSVVRLGTLLTLGLFFLLHDVFVRPGLFAWLF